MIVPLVISPASMMITIASPFVLSMILVKVTTLIIILSFVLIFIVMIDVLIPITVTVTTSGIFFFVSAPFSTFSFVIILRSLISISIWFFSNFYTTTGGFGFPSLASQMLKIVFPLLLVTSSKVKSMYSNFWFNTHL